MRCTRAVCYALHKGRVTMHCDIARDIYMYPAEVTASVLCLRLSVLRAVRGLT